MATENQTNETLPMEEGTIKNEKAIRKALMVASVVIAAVVIAVLVYVYFFRQPDIENGNKAIGEAAVAELFEGNDSVALQRYEAVAATYGHSAGNLAKLNAAILRYEKGDYEAALKMLEGYSATESMIGASAEAMKGDCLVNLDRLPEAAKAFSSAISRSDNNPSYTPYFMLKLATVEYAQENYAAAAKIYRELKEKYPAYVQAARIDVDKYLTRAEAMAAKK